MYIPEHFKETDHDRILAIVEAYPFGMLVTAPEGAPFVSHLPFLIEQGGPQELRLLGHMARANPQWRNLATDHDALVVFQGPHAYVSPNWYASPAVGPTWNYAVVHLRGKARLIEGEAALESLLERQVRVHEAIMPNPWRADLSGVQRTRLLRMIVGFEIRVTKVQAKFKLSQNRPEEDRRRVIDALARSGDQNEAAVARLMADPGQS